MNNGRFQTFDPNEAGYTPPIHPPNPARDGHVNELPYLYAFAT